MMYCLFLCSTEESVTLYGFGFSAWGSKSVSYLRIRGPSRPYRIPFNLLHARKIRGRARHLILSPHPSRSPRAGRSSSWHQHEHTMVEPDEDGMACRRPRPDQYHPPS